MVARKEAAMAAGAQSDLAHVLPRVLIVSRRTVRKNKFVDFVGEYHLDLIVKYGAVPVIVPRVMGVQSLLDSFEPIHGVLLCEGEDIDPSLYENDAEALSPEEIEEIKAAHASDAVIDHAKDSIELQLARRCLERNIPFMGICRGSQVLNVACGGSLYTDVEMELSRKQGLTIKHIDYANYDGHRHPITVVKGTPLCEWFQKSLEERGNGRELIVNSYHHQGVRRLAARFRAMAHAADGLVEAFYDPDTYDPENGKFIVGLQFHPERMRHDQDGAAVETHPERVQEQVFDYPECPRAYQEFALAVRGYQKRLNREENGAISSFQDMEKQDQGGEGFHLSQEMEQERQNIVRSFSLARQVYDEQVQFKRNSSAHGGSHALDALKRSNSQQELDKGADFLQENTALGTNLLRRLKAVGATVRNSSLAMLELRQKGGPRLHEEGGQLGEAELRRAVEYHERMADIAKRTLEAMKK